MEGAAKAAVKTEGQAPWRWLLSHGWKGLNIPTKEAEIRGGGAGPAVLARGSCSVAVGRKMGAVAMPEAVALGKDPNRKGWVVQAAVVAVMAAAGMPNPPPNAWGGRCGIGHGRRRCHSAGDGLWETREPRSARGGAAGQALGRCQLEALPEGKKRLRCGHCRRRSRGAGGSRSPTMALKGTASGGPGWRWQSQEHCCCWGKLGLRSLAGCQRGL